MKINEIAVRAVAKAYFAFCMIFGFYLVSHGHISHGAGFAGGVIIALGFLQVFLVLGWEQVSKVVNRENARLVAMISIAFLLLLSVAGYFYGKGFMSGFMSHGKPFTLMSGGITMVFNMALCFGVTGCLLLIYLCLVEPEKE